MELSKEELFLIIEAVNHSIAYRLNNQTRMSEVSILREVNRKIKEELSKKDDLK